MSFQNTELFGGAITVDIPTGFGDVSDIRQIPDNQEVYLDSNGFTSVIFDICERVEKPDEEALKIHFEDMVAGSGDETRLWENGYAKLEKHPTIPALMLLATQHLPPGPGPSQISTTPRRQPQPDFTALLFILVRLAEQKTDIVITVNVPHVPGEYPRDEVKLDEGKFGKFIEDAKIVKERVLGTFEIKDWGLFVN